MARSITIVGGDAWGWQALAEVLAGAGQHEQAARVAQLAEAAARSITDPDKQARRWRGGRGAGRSGPARAGGDRGPLYHHPRQAGARRSSAVAGALAEAGQHEQAAGSHN